MVKPERAILRVSWQSGSTDDIALQYNPSSLSFDKSAQIAEVGIPGLDSPLLQFVRGQNEKLTLELFFDTTEDGMGGTARSVTEETDQIYQLVKIEPERHAPPICEFIWDRGFPGGTALSSEIGGNQKRGSFKCVIESVSQKFTLFSPHGVPLRATLNVMLREYKPLEDQLSQLGLSSPDRTRYHVLEEGERLDSIAAQHYSRSSQWRRVAEDNGIDDPRRLTAGEFLVLSPTGS